MNKGLLNVDEALDQLLAGAHSVAEAETVATLSATGRVLAAAQRSTMNVPPMDNSAMDGYAVRLEDLKGPEPRLKVTQKIPAGSMGKPLVAGTAARIFTGAPIPAGADAIVMQEHCAQEGDVVVVRKIPARGEWIRLIGSDIRAGGEVLPSGIRLRPQDTGLAASVGIASLPVRRRVRLGLFFTGDELVMPGDPLPPGRIYNSNRFTLNGLAGIFGGELLMWKIAMKPGRPLAFGRVGKADFIGLPGNPVSSFVTFLIFVRPFLLKTQGVTDVRAHAISVRADFDWPEPDPRREFLRVKWNALGGLDLYPTQDSAVLMSTAWADGLVDNPAGHRIRAGDVVKFMPYSELYR